jgi:hypothetical protein
MGFDLRQFPKLSARIVKIGDRVFEIWSPNSTQLPFLPGERVLEPATKAAQDVSQRRYDGHSGKHDCLYCPQYFLEATSHWPFIRRISAVSSRDLVYPAFRSLIEGWNPSPLNATEGVWEAPFVQSLRSVMTILGMRMNFLRAGFRTGSTTWAR